MLLGWLGYKMVARSQCWKHSCRMPHLALSRCQTRAVYTGIYTAAVVYLSCQTRYIKHCLAFINVYQAVLEDLKSFDSQILALICFHQVLHAVIHCRLLFKGKVQGQTIPHLNELVNYWNLGVSLDFS